MQAAFMTVNFAKTGQNDFESSTSETSEIICTTVECVLARMVSKNTTLVDADEFEALLLSIANEYTCR
jgi:hypothetical protein